MGRISNLNFLETNFQYNQYVEVYEYSIQLLVA
jgi:hypothetical protein